MKGRGPRSLGGGSNFGVDKRETKVGEASDAITLDEYVWLHVNNLDQLVTFERGCAYPSQVTMDDIVVVNWQGRVIALGQGHRY